MEASRGVMKASAKAPIGPAMPVPNQEFQSGWRCKLLIWFDFPVVERSNFCPADARPGIFLGLLSTVSGKIGACCESRHLRPRGHHRSEMCNASG
jgi:hypothetical protein